MQNCLQFDTKTVILDKRKSQRVAEKKYDFELFMPSCRIIVHFIEVLIILGTS